MRSTALLFLAASSALAQPKALKLTWTAPRECPSAEDIEAEVDKLISDRGPSLAHLRVSVIVEQPVDLWTAKLTSESTEGNGERSYTAPDCQQLASATAVIIALALSPDRPAASTAVWFWALNLNAGADFGTLPLPPFAFGLELGLFRNSIGLRLRLGSSLPEHATGAPLAESSATLATPFAARLAACWEPLGDRLILDTCLGIDGALFQGTGAGLTTNATAQTIGFGPTAMLGIGVRFLGRWVLRLDGGATVPVVKPVFTIEGYGDLFRPAPVWGNARLGLEVRL